MATSWIRASCRAAQQQAGWPSLATQQSAASAMAFVSSARLALLAPTPLLCCWMPLQGEPRFTPWHAKLVLEQLLAAIQMPHSAHPCVCTADLPLSCRYGCGGAGVQLDSFPDTTLMQAQLAGNGVAGGIVAEPSFAGASLAVQDSLVAAVLMAASSKSIWQLPPQLLPQPATPGPYGWCVPRVCKLAVCK